jgi:IclR family transcriptional regulator, KDG regulon repressor
MKAKGSYHVQVLDRVFAILNTFEEAGPLVGVGELSKRLDLHKSTVFRLLKVLEQNKYVERAHDNGKYRLGTRVIHLGMRALASVDVAQASQVYLERLVSLTGETAHFGVLRHNQIISIAVAHGSKNLRLGVTVGGSSPPHCTALGKAILASLPPEECNSVIGQLHFVMHTAHTITAKSVFLKELGRVRERGYSIDNEEFESGLKCIGAPVLNYSGNVIGAISVAGPAFRLTKKKVTHLSRAVMQTADELSKGLGFRNPKVNSN